LADLKKTVTCVNESQQCNNMEENETSRNMDRFKEESLLRPSVKWTSFLADLKKTGFVYEE
jgi:hypothetical protein